MKPGRDLDALIAEKVMGWTRYPARDGRKELWAYPGMQPEANLWNVETPNYSTDIEKAWEVVDKLTSNEDTKIEISPSKFHNECEVSIQFEDKEGDTCGPFYFCSNSPAHAICLAALKSKGIDVSEWEK